MKRVMYPSGFIGFCSDAVADIYSKKPGFKVLGEAKPAPKPEPKPEPKVEDKK